MCKISIIKSEIKSDMFEIVPDEYSDCSNSDVLAKEIGIDEIELHEFFKKKADEVYYYEFREDKECNEKHYIEHFIDYNSDESLVYFFGLFVTKEKAQQCLDEILTVAKV